MYDKTHKKLNPTETIISAIPRLTEAFVTYYGELERENIENKFKNMLIIGYSSPEEVMRIISNDKKQKSTELIEELLDKLNIEAEKRKVTKEIYLKNYELEYPNLHPIFNYIEYINGKDNYKRLAVEFISKLYPQVTIENIDEFIKSHDSTEINKVAEIYNKILNQYNEYKKTFEPYEKYDEKYLKLIHDLQKEYTGKLVDEFKYLFTEEEYKTIKEKLNNSYINSIQDVNKKTKCYFGYLFYTEGLIDAFSKKSNELLIDGSNWKKESIIKDRIKFFKTLNIDLGDDYEAYLNQQDIQKLFKPLKDLAEKMINKRQELYTEMMNTYYQSLDDYQKNIERIEQAELLDKGHGYNANAYENHSTFINPNIKRTENGYITYPILCFSMEGLKEYLDKSLIHELNHVYELNLHEANEIHYHVTCGWEEFDEKLDKQTKTTVSLEKNRKKRNYELFNEIINELIAQEITEILFSSNGYIFNTAENAKNKGGTSYESTKFIVIDFYNTYKKEIIESRKNGDMSKLFEFVGKENFESLNELFHIFYKEFPTTIYYSTINSIMKKEETENTKKLMEIVEKRNQILNAMQEYSQKRTQSL